MQKLQQQGVDAILVDSVGITPEHVRRAKEWSLPILYTGQQPLSAAPRILAVQCVWTLLLTGFGLLLWRQNQRRLV